MEQIKRIKINGKDYEIKGDSIFIRYSANADGTGFTEKWSEGQLYMGIASGLEAPTDKGGYTWMNISDGNLVQYVREYVPKVATRNLMTLEFENGNISDNGLFVTDTSGKSLSASRGWLSVEGNTTYTLSWATRSIESYITIYEYSDTTYNAFVKRTPAKNKYWSTRTVQSRTFTTDPSTKWIRIKFYGNNMPWQDTIPSSFQMEIGSVATRYIPPKIIDNKIIDLSMATNEFKEAHFIFGSGSLLAVDGSEGYYDARIRTSYIPLDDLAFKCEEDITYKFFFYDENKTYITTSEGWEEGDSLVLDKAPKNASYVRVVIAMRADNTATISDIEGTASKLHIYGALTVENAKVKHELYMNNGAQQPDYVSDVPENIGVLNTILKMKQLDEIPYHTEAVIPQQVHKIPANTDFKGIPYSSSRIDNLFVPNFVSLETFMTAIKNPNSYLYTVDLGELGNVNGDTYYGCVCSTYCSYGLGLKGMYTTHQWVNVPDMELIEPQSPYFFKLGDTLVGKGHVLMVTDITRNKRGRIGEITLMDAWTDGIRARSFTPEDFLKEYPTSDYKYCRYKKIHLSEYTPSPFVAVEDETPQTFTYNTAIIARKGDKANWRAGETVEIDVLEKGNYTGVEIYKDNELLYTKDIANLISLSGLVAGSYKARLTDGTNHSDYCYWMVVDAVSTATPVGSDGKVNVTFSATNATPSFIIWQGNDGNGTKHIQFLTQEEINVGEAVGVHTSGTFKVRVAFETEYGVIFSTLPDAIYVP